MSPHLGCAGYSGCTAQSNASMTASPSQARYGRALAVQAPQIIRAPWVGKDEIAMRCFHSTPPSSPQAPPVETAVLNRLAHVLRLKVRRPLEVGDGASDLENPVIGPRRQREPRDRRAEQRVGTVRHAAEDADVP